jgi:hypothetical protein
MHGLPVSVGFSDRKDDGNQDLSHLKRQSSNADRIHHGKSAF